MSRPSSRAAAVSELAAEAAARNLAAARSSARAPPGSPVSLSPSPAPPTASSIRRHGHNGGAPRSSTARPHSTRCPARRAPPASSSASRVLPIPGGPVSTTSRPWPARASACHRRSDGQLQVTPGQDALAGRHISHAAMFPRRAPAVHELGQVANRVLARMCPARSPPDSGEVRPRRKEHGMYAHLRRPLTATRSLPRTARTPGWPVSPACSAPSLSGSWPARPGCASPCGRPRPALPP